ncbi:DUF7768 domain-containing protein [Pontibacter pamirensis]|uniref:DUF7768 domain-containing protein n=1 Tax=Pontibacter pamirensis TaxID=2562824 RepID=UPI00192E3E39|nr:hypothetical protein [Pontibacter pamirensis]
MKALTPVMYRSIVEYAQKCMACRPEQRAFGIEAGLYWGDKADKTVVYTDRGISRGMVYGIARALKASRPVEYRTL